MILLKKKQQKIKQMPNEYIKPNFHYGNFSTRWWKGFLKCACAGVVGLQNNVHSVRACIILNK